MAKTGAQLEREIAEARARKNRSDRQIVPVTKAALTDEEFRRADAMIQKLFRAQAKRHRAGEPLDAEAQKTIDAWEEAYALPSGKYLERKARDGMLFDIAHERGLL